MLLEFASESPGGLLKCRFCISNELPGDVDDAVLGLHTDKPESTALLQGEGSSVGRHTISCCAQRMPKLFVY